ncbi:hypothetical protein HBH98_144850 [Parastagonospora nodorum]|nr:hypothetical protein HBI10_171660 [Parastagonospora nodorum]KAH4016226.1 hypothetical protein HBI13_155100 [Parastagonospora nodorum]KAH4046953.1 hypothetical protein HBH49_175370 [Parastagonospora nodorum]KAH4101046.1 hypothetical protein HBH46_145640 [Parastagonospora nodorum]KAH4293406.1 hypothetical protein HBI01_172610 [Parastagonospora nodorum]
MKEMYKRREDTFISLCVRSHELRRDASGREREEVYISPFLKQNLGRMHRHQKRTMRITVASNHVPLHERFDRS